jgi:hypothetical protein
VEKKDRKYLDLWLSVGCDCPGQIWVLGRDCLDETPGMRAPYWLDLGTLLSKLNAFSIVSPI